MKKIQVTRPSMPSYDEYISEIKDLWDSQWITNMGIKHRRLQEELEAYLDVANVELIVNGHMALEMTLQAMDLKGEVITTPFTFASTTHAIVRNGLKPVFCDINENDYTIDVSKIEELITEKTSAIVPVHVYGNICDVDKINQIAKKYDLKVIYDAAHAFGETMNGVGIGNFGDASCFSFHATKVFNTIEGGGVCYSDKIIGNELYGLKNFGIRGPETVDCVGANAKMNEFSAAMGICNLRHLQEEIYKRRKVYERYVSALSNINGIKPNHYREEIIPNFSYFPVIFDGYKYTRDEIINRLAQEKIYARKYFYPLTNEFECYQGKAFYGSESTPVAKYATERVLTLPIYADLDLKDVDCICEIILGD